MTPMQRFKKPLEEDANGAAKLVTKEQVRLLFSSELPVMVGYSNMLINDLENNVLKNWNDNTKVGPVFVKMVRRQCLAIKFGSKSSKD